MVYSPPLSDVEAEADSFPVWDEDATLAADDEDDAAFELAAVDGGFCVLADRLRVALGSVGMTGERGPCGTN